MHIERRFVGVEDYVMRCRAALVPIPMIRMEIFFLLQLTSLAASEHVVELTIWLIFRICPKLAPINDVFNRAETYEVVAPAWSSSVLAPAKLHYHIALGQRGAHVSSAHAPARFVHIAQTPKSTEE